MFGLVQEDLLYKKSKDKSIRISHFFVVDKMEKIQMSDLVPEDVLYKKSKDNSIRISHFLDEKMFQKIYYKVRICDIFTMQKRREDFSMITQWI